MSHALVAVPESPGEACRVVTAKRCFGRRSRLAPAQGRRGERLVLARGRDHRQLSCALGAAKRRTGAGGG